MGKRLRWQIATWLNRLPGQCWTDLVCWALGWKARERRGPWSPQGDLCRSDAAGTGACYCGKLCDPITALEAAQREAGDG